VFTIENFIGLALLKHPLFKILQKDGWGKKPKKPLKTSEKIFNSENFTMKTLKFSFPHNFNFDKRKKKKKKNPMPIIKVGGFLHYQILSPYVWVQK
jgi:hypothetical protein